MAPSVSSLASWRTLAIVLALINLKCLPLAWHLRLAYRFVRNSFTPAKVQRAIKASADSDKIYPLFGYVSIFSRAPLLETDYNLHKSNSTYFTDLDESRMALMARILMPNRDKGIKALEEQEHKGRSAVILGSVHTSFHREIKPYERYEVRSRVLGWDKKWFVIASYFVRPATKGKQEVVLASALSKYVVKKGRFTVSPERCLMTAGWLPEKPETYQSGAGQSVESSGGSSSDTPTTTVVSDSHSAAATLQEDPSEMATPVPQGLLPAPVPATPVVEATSTVVDKLEKAAQKVSDELLPASEPLMPLTKVDHAGEWDWHRIEMERIRGLRVAANWLALDKNLLDEASRG
ncbi:hypothetical protein PV08_09313 [Exophiala spinifera]|uniref:Thioesterase domain-containing protein n=1 Tax=Exophiala spinifera TaxID=91928 RepID=A0A0D2BLJ7_9EURO|nr:uncharacterized protein PV08_09313 [Exophiala spinifera]KIW12039.1 hypothetical protein PV08_09313 [Exophiala spinifera]